MEIIFSETYLRDMYVTGKSDKKHRFQPQIIRGAWCVIPSGRAAGDTVW